MKQLDKCKGCEHYNVTDLELPCINCKHSHLGGEYEDLYHDPSQQAKQDAGKAPISLVPTGIIWAIAQVRSYGVFTKYPETGIDGWKTIAKERIRDAMLRHILRYIADPDGVDEESGLPHLYHAACNLAFLIEMEAEHGEPV